MGIKYLAGDGYKNTNKWVVNAVEKLLNRPMHHEKAEYYLAEQIATVAGVTTLALTKTLLDRTFPPGNSAHSKTRTEKPADYRTRIESSAAQHPVHAL